MTRFILALSLLFTVFSATAAEESNNYWERDNLTKDILYSCHGFTLSSSGTLKAWCNHSYDTEYGTSYQVRKSVDLSNHILNDCTSTSFGLGNYSYTKNLTDKCDSFALSADQDGIWFKARCVYAGDQELCRRLRGDSNDPRTEKKVNLGSFLENNVTNNGQFTVSP